MKRNSLSSKLLRTSIVVTALLILIVFSMFFQYYIPTAAVPTLTLKRIFCWRWKALGTGRRWHRRFEHWFCKGAPCLPLLRMEKHKLPENCACIWKKI